MSGIAIRQIKSLALVSLFITPSFLAAITANVLGQENKDVLLKERLLKELPPALERLEARFSRVTLSGILTEEVSSQAPDQRPGKAQGDVTRAGAAERAGPSLKSTSSFRVLLQASDGLKKSEYDTLFSKRYDDEKHAMVDVIESPLMPARAAACVGRQYSFRVRWEKGNPVLMAFGTADDRENYGTRILLWHRSFLQAPCCLTLSLPLSRILTFPSFSIRRIETIQENGRDHLIVIYEYDLADDKDRVIPEIAKKQLAAQGRQPAKHGMVAHWFQVCPDEDWTIHAHGGGDRSTSLRSTRSPRTRIEYSERRDGIMYPRRVIYEEPAPGRRSTLEIEKIDFGRVADSAFTLSSYGLPELESSPGAHRDNRLGMYAFGAAVLTLVIAIGLKYGADRLKKSQDHSAEVR